MGFAEQVSVGEGGTAEPSVLYTRRQAPLERPDLPGAAAAEASTPASAAAASGEEGGSSLDAILEAARGSGGWRGFAPAGGIAASDAAAAGPAAPVGKEPSLRLNVDEVDRENPLRPRYTGTRLAPGCACR